MPSSLLRRLANRVLIDLSERLQTGLGTGRPLPVMRSVSPTANTVSPRTCRNLEPGIWRYSVESFCLGAGRSEPVRGSRYDVARIEGHSDVSRVLRGLADHPDISQNDAQRLLWGLRAGQNVAQMSTDLRRAAEHIVPGITVRSSVRSLATGWVKSRAIAALLRASRALPDELVAVLKSVQDIAVRVRRHVPYEELERMAIMPPPPDVLRDARNEWVLVPSGCFIKLYPRGYRRSDILVKVPGENDAYVIRNDQGLVSRFGCDDTSVRLEYESDRAFLTVAGAGSIPVWKVSQIMISSGSDSRVINDPGWIPARTSDLAAASDADPQLCPLVAAAQVVAHDYSELRRYYAGRAKENVIADVMAYKLLTELANHVFGPAPRIQDEIPAGRRNRPGTPMEVRYITMHDTANTNRGADAEAHGRYLRSEDCRDSWHFTVDDKEIRQHLPTDEIAYHVRNKKGRRTSIGIEICMHEGIDRDRAEKKAARLVADLLLQFNLGTDAVVPHSHWDDKDCPVLLSKRWESFVEDVTRHRHRALAGKWLGKLQAGLERLLLHLSRDQWTNKFKPEELVGLPGDRRQQRLGMRLIESR